MVLQHDEREGSFRYVKMVVEWDLFNKMLMCSGA